MVEEGNFSLWERAVSRKIALTLTTVIVIITIRILIKINKHLQMITSKKSSKLDNKSTSIDLKNPRVNGLQKKDILITKV